MCRSNKRFSNMTVSRKDLQRQAENHVRTLNKLHSNTIKFDEAIKKYFVQFQICCLPRKLSKDKDNK